ncbi:sulfite exporter TauE/SafE family protein [Halobacteriales archaeon Cl-PHB]
MAACSPANPLLGTESVGLPVLFLVGLLGGAHCIGMCGPLVATYADRMRTGARRSDTLTLGEVRQHTLFNLGRVASYATIGALVGLAGELVFVSIRDVTLVATEVYAVTGVLAGLVIVGVGLRYATGRWTGSIPGIGRLIAGVQARVVPHVDSWVGDYRIVGLGAVHGLFPCPLLYPAYLYAFAQGSALGGAVALGALGLGTLPAVFLTGTAFLGLDVGGRERLTRALGLAFVLLGYIPLQHGLANLGVPLPAVPLPHFQPW